MSKCIIIGSTGQFGFYLTKYLISKKNNTIIITSRSNSKLRNFHLKSRKIKKLKFSNFSKHKIKDILLSNKPNKIFFFTGQSSVKKSFNNQKETFKSNYLICKNFIESIKELNIDCKFINATSSDMFGNNKNKIKPNSKLKPLSPYGLAKSMSFNLIKTYREKYKLKLYNAIIFNTESVLRDKEFFIPKICLAAIRAYKYRKKTKFGNLNISREWNWCEEQVKYMYLFSNKHPQDFILSNGKNYTGSQMANFAFRYFNLDYKKFTLLSKIHYRKKDIKNNKSDFNISLKKNNLTRRPKIYGKKIIEKIIEHYMKKKFKKIKY